MAKINIQAGIISSSADYSLYHGASPLATVEAGGLRVQGDLIAENYIVSSSVTYMTTSFSDGSTVFGNTIDDTHLFTGSLFISGNLTAVNLTGILSSSAQIASDISGSWKGELSSSAITFVGGGVSGSATSTGSFGSLVVADKVQGNTTFAGTITTTGHSTIPSIGTTTIYTTNPTCSTTILVNLVSMRYVSKLERMH